MIYCNPAKSNESYKDTAKKQGCVVTVAVFTTRGCFGLSKIARGRAIAFERSLDSVSDEEAHAKCRSNNGERQDKVDSNSMSSRLRQEEQSRAFPDVYEYSGLVLL